MSYSGAQVPCIWSLALISRRTDMTAKNESFSSQLKEDHLQVFGQKAHSHALDKTRARSWKPYRSWESCCFFCIWLILYVWTYFLCCTYIEAKFVCPNHGFSLFPPFEYTTKTEFNPHVLNINTHPQEKKPNFANLNHVPTQSLVTREGTDSYGPLPTQRELGEISKRHGPPRKLIGKSWLFLLLDYQSQLYPVPQPQLQVLAKMDY